MKVSNDPGSTWQAMALPTGAKWVRSIAVHSTDPNVLLFAAGHADESGQVTTGLWRSEDAGAAWSRVTGKIDFRGDQATALCGEVIALDQADPKFGVAGGDRVGVMVNEDGGLKRLVRQDRA